MFETRKKMQKSAVSMKESDKGLKDAWKDEKRGRCYGGRLGGGSKGVGSRAFIYHCSAAPEPEKDSEESRASSPDLQFTEWQRRSGDETKESMKMENSGCRLAP